jgi:preprotein translocase subunit SecY
MPLKLNISGVLAPIFAAVLLGFVRLLFTWPLFQSIPVIGRWAQLYLTTNSVWLMLVQVTLIVFFCFFYTTIVFNPEETAENLRKNGAFIPGYRPGAMTQNYLIYVIDRLTVLGSTYIAFVAVLPDLLSRVFQVQFPFQGTSFLIAVSVSLELISQIHSYIISHQYGSLLRNKVTKG